MRKIFITLLLVSLLCPLLSYGAPLGIPGEKATTIGLFVKDLKSGKVIEERNSELSMTPASVMKSITTATALSLLGGNWEYSTPVSLSGYRAPGIKDLWKGNIIIDSSCDPTLDSDNFKEYKGFCDSISSKLKAMGIKKVEGRIIVNQSLKDSGPVWNWEIEDVAWAYGAALYGFNFQDNIFKVYPATGKSVPYVPGLQVRTISNPSGNDMVRGINSNILTVYGKNPGNKDWSMYTTMPNPADVFVNKLTGVLKQNGITVTGHSSASSKDNVKVIYTHISPKAKEIMRSLMVRSDNMFAEGMLRKLDLGGSREDAIKKLKEYWKKEGVNSDYTAIYDGSGLTRGNRLQPVFIAGVLEKMLQRPDGKLYVSFFPKAGKEGTMRNFLANSRLTGKIAMKTGSVGGVQTYAGYKLDDDGNPTHIIVIMVNGFFCPRADVKKASEKFLATIFAK